MNVILTAGGVPLPDEPLYPFTQGGYKALLDIAGKPMIQWVLDALSASKNIDRITVVGLPEKTHLASSKPMTMIESRGDMVTNILEGVASFNKQTQSSDAMLIVASDIPGLSSAMVDWFIDIVEQSNNNVYYNVISKQVMENRFPGSRRTYVHLKDLEVCGGDMNALRADVITADNANWQRLVEARKSPIKQASIIGFDTLLSLLLRRLTLKQAEVVASKRLGVRGQVIQCPYAEVGMDVDKPHQLEILRTSLS